MGCTTKSSAALHVRKALVMGVQMRVRLDIRQKTTHWGIANCIFRRVYKENVPPEDQKPLQGPVNRKYVDVSEGRRRNRSLPGQRSKAKAVLFNRLFLKATDHNQECTN
jgi:hypothetical protein